MRHDLGGPTPRPDLSGGAPAPPAGTRATGRSFGGRLKLFLVYLVALPFVVLTVTEVLHRVQRGHFFVPFTYHWDLDVREVDVRGNKLREVRPRLTNYTLAPLRIERLEGDGLLWFRETRYRHHVENRVGDSGPWRALHREDLVYERQGRPPHTRNVTPWGTIAVAWHPVQDAGTSGPRTVLRRGDEVRFVLFTQLDGEENAPTQRVYRSPPFKL